MARVLARNIRKFLNHIKQALAQLASHGLFNKINEAFEKLLSVKISSSSQTDTQEEIETPSQERFWDQAVKVMEEIECTMKVKESYERPSYCLEISSMRKVWASISEIARQDSENKEEERRNAEEEKRRREDEEEKKVEEMKRRREEEESRRQEEEEEQRRKRQEEKPKRQEEAKKRE